MSENPPGAGLRLVTMAGWLAASLLTYHGPQSRWGGRGSGLRPHLYPAVSPSLAHGNLPPREGGSKEMALRAGGTR